MESLRFASAESRLRAEKASSFNRKWAPPSEAKQITGARSIELARGSVLLSYQPEGIKAFSIDEIIGDGTASGTTFDDFFLGSYLACRREIRTLLRCKGENLTVERRTRIEGCRKVPDPT